MRNQGGLSRHAIIRPHQQMITGRDQPDNVYIGGCHATMGITTTGFVELRRKE